MEIDIPPQLAIPGMLAALASVFWSADRMLLNAVALSRQLHLSPFAVGAIVIGFGTSAPEIATSIFAALNHKLEIAVGNALGSDTANILLILGVVSLVATLRPPPTAGLRQQSFILLLATALPGLLLLDNYQLNRSDAFILLSVFAACLYYLKKTEAPIAPEKISPPRSGHTGFRLLVFLAVLLVSSQAVISCAASTARHFDVSELIIGLSVIAVGTSLPELSTTLASVRRKHYTVALGNIFGSNIFNSLAVIGIPVLISPQTMPSEVLTRDYPVAVGATLLLFLLMFLTPPRLSLGRLKGGLLVACFIAYQTALYLETVR